MGNLSAIYAQLLTNLGQNADAASTTGTANAKLAALLTLVQGTTGVGVTFRGNSIAIVNSTSSGTGYTWTPWQEIVAASVIPNCMITHVLMGGFLGSTITVIPFQIGAGGAGSESAIWDGIQADSQQGSPLRTPITLPRPLRIAANTRVSVRAISNGQDVPFYVVLIFMPTPF